MAGSNTGAPRVNAHHPQTRAVAPAGLDTALDAPALGIRSADREIFANRARPSPDSCRPSERLLRQEHAI